MANELVPFASESYLVVTSDNRRFVIRTADPETAKRNFPVPGESIHILSMKPVVEREKLLTVQELADVLAEDCSKPPHWQTILLWAKQRRIPCRRVGAKFLRFVEADVRAAMAKFERA